MVVDARGRGFRSQPKFGVGHIFDSGTLRLYKVIPYDDSSLNAPSLPVAIRFTSTHAAIAAKMDAPVTVAVKTFMALLSPHPPKSRAPTIFVGLALPLMAEH